ncbi:uncharacterized protein LOC134726775 [Mytilus trossulus]|uniref:uncharacterized protein LOC134726775 n=1 Tax=Mytilus trossulus TaxID=6551 RepID=UPI003006EBAB
MGRVNPTFENDDVSSKDETIKVAMVSPMIRMAEPPIEHKQIDTTKAESKDRVNLCQTVDDNDDDFHATRHSTSLARSGDPKEEDNRNAETQQGIHERSDRTVDNAEYFDTASHLESVASYEDTKQKENKNAAARLEINERSGRTVDNAGYFDTTTHLEKEHNHNDPETAIKNYQTKSYTNQAFDGEYNQEEDAVSFPVRLLDRVQVDEQNNQNDDKQSKHDYENVGSTAQPKSSNGDTIH